MNSSPPSMKKGRKSLSRLAVSDKVMLLRPIESVECFRPCPVMGQVYCVREVRDTGSIRLVGVAGTHEQGEEVWLVADKFHRISPAQATRRPGRPRRRKGGQP